MVRPGEIDLRPSQGTALTQNTRFDTQNSHSVSFTRIILASIYLQRHAQLGVEVEQFIWQHSR
jgi:hypothetical protein